ncbi:seminal vesicle secretory protein 2-like isoform X1 [Meles meles]|uniref:seminal vesicle secretory protein 2-like isoform X1 n=1 Tax=Meles meles TaxID=9662 RepID=UPI001E69B4BF|nr:seminal vesicle secretory protein 2-like isoform X1 [Meles meles]XP_045870963.1 seminal vesicle secretory protein 2-like isoform X1 [Meles meles]
MRGLRGKPHRVVRRRRKARRRSARGRARVQGWSHLEPGSRGAQMLRENVWVPWKGLIVIGKRMELLGRHAQKLPVGDPKLDPQHWRPEDVGKVVLKAKSGQSLERMDMKLPHSVASSLQAPEGLGENSPKEMGGGQEIRDKMGAESESAGTTAGSRRGSGFKERLKFSGMGIRGEDLRSGPHTPEQNEEAPGSSGEQLRSSGEQLSGEKPRSSVEQLRSSGELLRSSGEQLRSSGELLRSSGELLRSSGEQLRSSGEPLSGEKSRSSGEQLSGEKLTSSEKLSLSGEKLRSSGEKEGSREEKPESSGEDLRSTGDKLKSSADKLEGSGMESVTEETTERVVEVTNDEKQMKVTNAEMENPFERAEGNDEELQRTEEAVGVEKDVLGGVNDPTEESVSIEEKEVVDEGDDE